MCVYCSGEVNIRHYLVFSTFPILFLKSKLEMDNSVLHLFNFYVTICILYVHKDKC